MFKVNDRVKIVDTDYYSAELANGNTGTVISTGLTYGSKKPYLAVKLDSGYTPMQFDEDEGEGWNFFPEQLELVA